MKTSYTEKDFLFTTNPTPENLVTCLESNMWLVVFDSKAKFTKSWFEENGFDKNNLYRIIHINITTESEIEVLKKKLLSPPSIRPKDSTVGYEDNTYDKDTLLAVRDWLTDPAASRLVFHKGSGIYKDFCKKFGLDEELEVDSK